VRNGAKWCILGFMASKNAVRQSISLPSRLACRVRDLAKTRRQSANKILVELIEKGIQSEEEEKERFFALTERLIRAKDARERALLKEELARMTFGP